MNGFYTYTIDNNPTVIVTSNQSSSDVLDGRGFKVNPKFSYLVNVSNLTNGYHEIVIEASIYGGSISFSASSSPVPFLVQNPTPTPTPTPAIGALISLLTIIVVVTVVVLVAVIVSLSFYRKHRKISDLNT
jgi:hypothetical protein